MVPIEFRIIVSRGQFIPRSRGSAARVERTVGSIAVASCRLCGSVSLTSHRFHVPRRKSDGLVLTSETFGIEALIDGGVEAPVLLTVVSYLVQVGQVPVSEEVLSSIT